MVHIIAMKSGTHVYQNRARNGNVLDTTKKTLVCIERNSLVSQRRPLHNIGQIFGKTPSHDVCESYTSSLSAVLRGVQLVIRAAQSHKVVVRAMFDDAIIVYHRNQVGGTDSA